MSGIGRREDGFPGTNWRLARMGTALIVSVFAVVGAMPCARAQTYTETILHRFSGYHAEHVDGSGPFGTLIQDAAGNLYGTTTGGGAHGEGTVYEIEATGKEMLLHSFFGPPDGSDCVAGLLQDSAGNLYGTSDFGGDSACGSSQGGCGVVFELHPKGKARILHSFGSSAGDGYFAYGGLTGDPAGNLYGTTSAGGSSGAGCTYEYGCGTVFKIAPGGVETVLYNFCSLAECADGQGPDGTLVRDAAGNLFGTTEVGGAYNFGTVFKLDAAGNETVLHSFGSFPSDGQYPLGGLTADPAGNLYGVTPWGGQALAGTVYKIDRTGTETVLFSFDGADGAGPEGALVIDPNGNLYGTTESGGAYGVGTVFKLDRTGTETVLYSFAGGYDGALPIAGLLRDGAGNLYGTTAGGGGNSYWCDGGCGTVFRLTPQR